MRIPALSAALMATLVTPGATSAEPPKPAEVIELWPGDPPGETGRFGPERDSTKSGDGEVAGRRVTRLTDVSRPTLSVYRPDDDVANGTAVIVCPGGGYHILAWDLEGTEVAEWLNSVGVTACVLKYRVPFRDPAWRWRAAVQDAQRAVSVVRSKAEGWGIRPDRVGILGFSAGGNAAALTALLPDRQYPPADAIDQAGHRPDFATLVYPGYLATEDNTRLRDEVRVGPAAPPMFFAHAFDDPVRVENSLLLAAALKSAGGSAELHIYAKGGHGFGLRRTEEPATLWPQRCEEWMRRSGWLGR